MTTKRRFLAAVLCAGVFATLGDVVGVFAQSPFNPQVERQLWKQLPIWTNLLNNRPSHLGTVIGIDDFGVPIIQSGSADFASEFAALNPGECTFSHKGDFDWEVAQNRQCKAANGSAVPPPPGALLLPVALATDTVNLGGGNLQHRVYVVDGFNNRVQVFDFNGNVIQLAHPIGSGNFGRGPYSYPGGASGELLDLPYGISVDSSHRILVADGGNRRLAVFNSDGSLAFDAALPDGISGETRPNQVTLSPGAAVLPPGSAVPASAVNTRILVTDWAHCHVQVFDAAFNLINSLPQALPAVSQHDACLEPQFGAITGPGEFSTVTGAAIDLQGHIYIADHAQNTVQVFDRNLNHLGWIGKPGQATGQAVLDGPVGVAIDHLGRVGISDSGHARVAFYTVTYLNGAPVADFQFQLDSTIDVDDFSMGMAEQWGTSAGLDEKGRFLATDPFNRRVLRYELPELGIVNATADSGVGSFDVAVPSEKLSAVAGVTVTVTPVEPGVQIIGTPTPGAPRTIPPGQLVSYQFTYTSPVPRATFVITAVGNGGNAHADPTRAIARMSCGNCGATHEIFEDPESESGPVSIQPMATPTGDWYDRELFARITPTGADPVTGIFWYLEGAAGQVYGGSINESALESDGYVDVRVRVAGASALWYWPLTEEGSIGARVRVPLNIDLQAPNTHFSTWTPRTGTIDVFGNQWHNVDVTATYVVTDDGSGSASDTNPVPNAPDGSINFTAEGRGQARTFNVLDRVGHVGDADSMYSSGGRPVNIDKTAPTFTFVPANMSFMSSGNDASGAYVDIPSEALVATAVDPNLSSGEPGSGVATITNPGFHRFYFGTNTWNFTATDHAGNSTTVSRIITVTGKGTGISTISRVVQYGQPVTLTVLVAPVFATGIVTFHFGPYTVTAPVVSGVANATIPHVFASVGWYPLEATFDANESSGGTDSVLPSGASVVVTKKLATVAANAKTKVYGAALPALDATVTGTVNGETINYSLNTSATLASAVGGYPITVTAGSNPNYMLTVANSTLTITPRPITVTANAATKLAGLADPVFTYAITSGGPLLAGGALTGTPTRAAGELPGLYAILQGTVSAGPNYAITWVPASLSITSSNNAPVANPDVVTGVGSAPISIPVLSNDTDSNLLDVLSLTGVTQPSGGAGVVTTSGNIVVFTPTPGFVGTATFTYTISDGHGGTAKGAVTVTISPAVCGSISLTGNTPTSGSAGNIRTFTLNGVSVKVSAFSRARNNGSWATAYVGAYGTGLGVTDGSEGSGNDDHKLDNVGARPNYLLFEFSQPVVVTRAYLDAVGDDSDATIWLGTKANPYVNHLTLSDSVLTSLGTPQQNVTTSDSARWATFATTNATANVIVIAADVFDTSAEDEFKVSKLELNCLGNRMPDAQNDTIATVKNTAKTVSLLANDSDPNGDVLTVTSVTQPAKGSVVKYSNGTVKYTPPSNWVGTTSFTYTVSDGHGGTDTATVSVTVSNHTDNDNCGADHDHDGDHDGDDDRERDDDHDHDCDHHHSSGSHCNDNRGWYNWNWNSRD